MLGDERGSPVVPIRLQLSVGEVRGHRRVWWRFLGLEAFSLSLLISVVTAVPLTGQSTNAWRFIDDPLTNLWFHGLAVVGFHGNGPMPLYDPGYRVSARADLDERGVSETQLERERESLLQEFTGDSAFEILHFVPLYFYGASLDAALEALQTIARGRAASNVRDAESRRGASAVAAILGSSAERRVLGSFVETLAEERTALRAIRALHSTPGEPDPFRTLELARVWSDDFIPAFSDFFAGEDIAGGVVLLTQSLGAEGRFLDHGEYGALVAIGASRTVPAAMALGALMRELCYPVVRRAFAPFTGEFRDRVIAQRASDQAATRCGEILMETRLPAYLVAYRDRFGIPADGSGPGFLSGAGFPRALRALEAPLDQALRNELRLGAR